MNKFAWVTSSYARSTPWGSEVYWSGLPSLHGKLLSIKKDHKTSLKYHKLKDELLFVMSGKVKIIYGRCRTAVNPDEYPFVCRTLTPGDVMVIQAGSPYRLEALEEAQIVEVGNRQDEQATRLLDDYGRELGDFSKDWRKYIKELE